MPVANVRIVVSGVPRADRAFTVLVVDRNEAQRLAEQLATQGEAARREAERVVREIVRGGA